MVILHLKLESARELKKRKMMRLFFLLVFIGLFSCKKNSKKNDNLLFYYTGSNQYEQFRSDTFNASKINHHSKRDILLVQQEFQFNNKSHFISVFTNDLYAPIDAGYLIYELDTIGAFYSRSTTWYSYRRLKSNNDSINLVIDAAIENILLYPKLSCPQYEIVSNQTIEFEQPKVKEKE